MKLKRITDIRNGYQFRGKVEPVHIAVAASGRLPRGVVPVIQIKDIDADRRLVPDNLVSVKIDGDAERFEVRQGDVLFLARGHRLFATAITTPLRGTVATGYFFILRPTSDKLLPQYLAWYINQPPFQAALRPFIKGTHQPLVSRKDIEDLAVEIPPLEIQGAVVALDELRVKEVRLLAALQEKRSKLIQSISMQAARRPA